MRVLTNTFIDVYRGRLINLHPSLPGGLIGTDCIKRTWDLYHDKNPPNDEDEDDGENHASVHENGVETLPPINDSQ